MTREKLSPLYTASISGLPAAKA
ncbi:hypothetical protein [Aeromonas bestiarum]